MPQPSFDTPMEVAVLLVESLHKAGVKYVFGIPGAKIDAVFNALLDHPEIKLIVCRHEQNAGFMAAAVGRLTGTPGVCIATSGPGSSNLCTPLATATTEGDPVVALIGDVPRALSTKHTHQSMRSLDMLSPITKKTLAIAVQDQAAEVLLESFRSANTYPKGAVAISLPQDIASLQSSIHPFPAPAFVPPLYGPAPSSHLSAALTALKKAKLPVLLLGMRASAPKVIYAIRSFLSSHPIPVVETFQAAGAISRDLLPLFYGRVGLFRNQPGDKLLARSDCVVAVGYDPTEYDASFWNPGGRLNVVHIDYQSCSYEVAYRPSLEVLGGIAENFAQLARGLEAGSVDLEGERGLLRELKEELGRWRETSCVLKGGEKVKPLHFVRMLQERVGESTTVVTDVGTVYIYMMRYFYAFRPRGFLSSNGQQTLGVGLPWAVAANLVQDPPCSKRVVSVSGDGGFMFSSNELSTAVQQGCKITHFIWNDSAYNMVQFQEELKYGRSSGIALGGVDFVKYAEAFGAKGMRISEEGEMERVMDEALRGCLGDGGEGGVVIVDVNIDYSEAQGLAGKVLPGEW
ncbi:hypothetical protein MMC10_008184 [Thelotrema lepadinum]|nr:hypothetical protein [Thelotrema lepadinum]